MAQTNPTIDWDDVLETAGAYPIEAINFVREGLSYTVDHLNDDDDHNHPGPSMSMGELDRHVSGQELCLGLRDYAIDQYGLLAPAVLNHWNIQRTDDFGKIVFAMIEFGIMSRTPDDTQEDFSGVYDFKEAFSRHELIGRIGRSA